jgi:single-strand DNA-binding protein
MGNLKIEGTIVKIFEREAVTATFSKREFVIEVPDGNYPQMVKFQMTQDRCDVLDRFSEGQTVTVHFNLRGREWQGKYFNSLDAWKIEANSGAQPNASTGNTTTAQNAPQNSGNEATGQVAGEGEQPADENLPF